MTFANVDDWRSDRQAERDGIEIPLGRDRFIRIRRAGGANRAFWNHGNEVAQRMAEELGHGDTTKLTEEQWESVQVQTYAERIVVDWRGFLDEEGSPIPFSPQAFVELCEFAPDIWDLVRTQSNRRERFRREAIERDKDALKKD